MLVDCFCPECLEVIKRPPEIRDTHVACFNYTFKLMCQLTKFRFTLLQTTAAFTYYYDPAILRNKLTPLSIFNSSSEKVRFKNVYGLLL